MGSKSKQRLGEVRCNNQGCLMKIIKYINSGNIIIQFQDKYKTEVHTDYDKFLKGKIKNPYYPSVYDVGIIGKKYIVCINRIATKEYSVWNSMLKRCFDKKYKKTHPTYQDVTCCEEWLLFENFYEWLHNQENFDKWYNGDNDKWAIDKDILVKNNKIYSPETCCLVPQSVNNLFTKCSAVRGDLPIGVIKSGNKFKSYCKNPFTNKQEYLGTYQTIEQAFEIYKNYKENIIKQMAKKEYAEGNITKQCYKTMINYIVEITD